jgi:hypothetical protein
VVFVPFAFGIDRGHGNRLQKSQGQQNIRVSLGKRGHQLKVMTSIGEFIQRWIRGLVQAPGT